MMVSDRPGPHRISSHHSSHTTTVRFKKIENNLTLSDNSLRQTALQKYLTLIEDMNNFERINYENFLAKGTKTVNDILKRNISKLKIIKAPNSKYKYLINDKTVTANCF